MLDNNVEFEMDMLVKVLEAAETRGQEEITVPVDWLIRVLNENTEQSHNLKGSIWHILNEDLIFKRFSIIRLKPTSVDISNSD